MTHTTSIGVRSSGSCAEASSSYSDLSQVTDRSMLRPLRGWHLSTRTCMPLLSLRPGVCHPKTRMYGRLLGPCYKTGGRTPFPQQSRIRRISSARIERRSSATRISLVLRPLPGLTPTSNRIVLMNEASVPAAVCNPPVRHARRRLLPMSVLPRPKPMLSCMTAFRSSERSNAPPPSREATVETHLPPKRTLDRHASLVSFPSLLAISSTI